MWCPHRESFFKDAQTPAAHRQDDVFEKRRAADGVYQSII